MPRVFLDGWARPLLVLHALAGFALLGACTHQALVSIGLLRGRTHLFRLARIYAAVIGPLFAGGFAIGLLIYPHYRYHVRGLYLDRYVPWASNLFDMKENLLALGVPLALFVFAVGRRLQPPGDDDERDLTWLHAAASLTLWAIVAFGTISGVIVTSVRGI
jgi:hypothetical protein